MEWEKLFRYKKLLFSTHNTTSENVTEKKQLKRITSEENEKYIFSET